MPMPQVPRSASLATITLANLVPFLCGLILSSLHVRCTAFAPLLHAIGVNLIVAVFHTGKWSVRRPYSKDGKIHRFNGRNRNCRVRGYLCAVGLERASLMPPNPWEAVCGFSQDNL
jgi:hypothetical protein